MWDETAKDNGQTAAGISGDLIWNNELVLSSTRNLQFSLCISQKKPFLPQSNTTLSVQKPNYWIDLKVSANSENLQLYRFVSWVKVSQLQKQHGSKNHQSHPTSMTFWTACATNTEEHCLLLAHFFSLSDTLSICVWLTATVFLI